MASKKKFEGLEVEITAPRPTTPLKRLKRKLDRASDDYTQWQKENPGTKLIADSAPVSSFATGVGDLLNDTYTGNYASVPVDAISLIPGTRFAGKVVSAGADALRNGTPIIDALRNIPGDPRFIRRIERAITKVGRTQDRAQAVDQAVRNETGYAKGGMVKKKFEGPEVVVTAPRMSAMEQYLYDERQKPEAQRRQEIIDTAMGFASPGAAIEGAGLKGLARNASPEFSAGRRKFLGDTGKIATAAAIPGALKAAAPAVEKAAPAAVKPVQKTIEELSEEMFAKGIKSVEQQKAYILSHIDAGKVAPVRMRDKKILHSIFDPAEVGEFVPLRDATPVEFQHLATDGSTTLPNNYRAGGRVRMI